MTAAPAVEASLACDVCASIPCLTPGFCRACRAADERQERARGRTIEKPSRSTPRTTIEAILHCVRERGPRALHEPANIERLSHCDDAAIREIDARVKKLEEKYYAP
jgi:hypothetical protein